MFEAYHTTVRYLESLSRPFGGAARPEVYLERMQYFLDLLGNPEKNLRIVHVTGTAGKGSVSRMIQSMLVKSGEVTGLFTSPFVTTTIEKIQVNDLYISPADFVAIVDHIKPHLEAAAAGPFGAPTYFEIIFACALEYFKRSGCTWAVLEVGLGGRYDATNIVKNPAVTVITTINYDHMAILGKTLTKIAYDKAGIIKRGSTFFTAEHRPTLLSLFKKICAEVGATFNKVHVTKGDFHENNRTLAKAVGKHLGIADAVIDESVTMFKMPARFEIIQHNPLIIIDGAHSPIKIESVVEQLKSLKRGKYKMAKIKALVAFSVDKDVDKMLKSLGELVDEYWITEFTTALRNALNPEQIEKALKKAYPTATSHVIPDPQEAMKNILKNTSPDDIIVVTGSFYLAGVARGFFYPEELILKERTSFPL